MLDSLKAQAEDTFKAYAANHWDADSESLIGMDYVGDYILTPKEDSFWVDNDIVTLVYKINVHNRYIDSGLQQYSFSDSTMNWYYYGYATIDDLYSAAVTRNIEKYNHQDNVSA